MIFEMLTNRHPFYTVGNDLDAAPRLQLNSIINMHKLHGICCFFKMIAVPKKLKQSETYAFFSIMIEMLNTGI